MTYEILSLILAALTAFFTLITGALAIAATIGVFYFRKLAGDRQREIEKLIDLQSEVANKIRESEKAIQDLGEGKSNIARISNELAVLQNEYSKISSRIYPAPTIPSFPFIPSPYEYSKPKEQTLSTADLQAQITALLNQIQELQEQLTSASKEAER